MKSNLTTRSMLALISASLIALSGCGSNGGGGSPSGPQRSTTPINNEVINPYDGQRFQFVSPDKTCVSTLLLTTLNAGISVKDEGNCRVLLKDLVNFDCHDDNYCSARLDDLLVTISLHLDSTDTLTFVVRNDVEGVDHTAVYHLVVSSTEGAGGGH